MQINMVSGSPQTAAKAIPLDPERPFRLLVLGDFGGPAAWQAPEPLDPDSWPALPQRLGTVLRWEATADCPAAELPVRSPADFHPDHWFATLPLFESLRTSRGRLENDATFRDEAKRWTTAAETTGQVRSNGSGSTGPTGSSGSLFDQVLEETRQSQQSLEQQLASGSFDLAEFIQRTVAPHLVDARSRRESVISVVDQAISGLMRQLMSQPSFRRQQAAWLGLQWLVRRLETGPECRIDVVHVSRADLVADLQGHPDPTQSRLFQLLAAGADEDQPWSAVVGDFSFSAEPADAGVLERLMQVLAGTGVVFLAGVAPPFAAAIAERESGQLDDPELRGRWQALRTRAGSNQVVLVAPRILGRLPYGANTDAVESFAMEELPEESEGGSGGAPQDVSERLVWVNPAFAAACLVGAGFGRDSSRSQPREFEELPVWLRAVDGETAMHPVVEQEWDRNAASRAEEWGVTPVHAVRDQAMVLVPKLVSMASSQPSVPSPE